MESLRPTPKEMPPIIVKLGEPFYPFSNFDPQLISMELHDETHEIASYKVTVEGLGSGIIILGRDDLEELLNTLAEEVRTPAGPIEFKVRMDNNAPEIVFSSAPLYVDVVLDKIEKEHWEGVKCFLLFLGGSYEGKKNVDEIPPQNTADISFYEWYDPQTTEAGTFYFPPDLQILSEIGFVFSRT